MARVLKPGGELLVTIPFAWEEHELPFDYARYTSAGIRHELEKSKFEITEIEKTTTQILAISQTFIAYLSNHILPKVKILGGLSQVLVVFPLTLFAICLNRVLPKNYNSFCNLVIYARKSNFHNDSWKSLA
jgi:hypothetical protein